MKTKTFLITLAISTILVSCIPLPTGASSPTATSTPILTTPTYGATATIPQPSFLTSTPFVEENASKDCFLAMDFIPGKTRMQEVRSVWGAPARKSSLDAGFEDWYFDFAGTPRVSFRNETLQAVILYLENCTLEDIVAKLGPPEKVEVTVLINCIDLSESFIQDFYFTSLRFAYFRYCDETQNCFTFQANHKLNGKEFYPAGKTITDSTGFNMAGYVYNWHGFGVDVEGIENKVKDFVTITPAP